MANIKKLTREYGNIKWAGKKCILGLPISFTHYIITDTKLITKIGFFSIHEDEIELYRVIDKAMKFTLGQRIFGCGSIIVTAKDTDTPKKTLVSIKKPREVKRIFDEAVQEQRDKYYVRGRDMMGGASHEYNLEEVE